MKRLLPLACLLLSSGLRSQACDSLVPSFSVNFTGANAGTTFTSPNTQKNGYCCTASGASKCVHFTVLVDSNTTGISLSICGGSVPLGALYYEIDCTQQVPMDDTAAITPGVHDITFCLPGNSSNLYCLASLPQSTAGLAGLADKIQVTLAPNPFSESAVLVLDKPGKYDLEIYDLTGKLVKKQIIDAHAIINRGSLMGGLYFYVLRNAGATAKAGKLILE
jgi:hypothetical protein